jgi:hypothetical protein
MENSSNQSLAPSISLILKKISDDKTISLFNAIAAADGKKFIPLKAMNLTTKQYYSRISGLLNAGLIKRHKGKYSLTLLGKVVYDSQVTIGKTLAYYWKLKAIESFEMSAAYSSRHPNDEITELIEALIDNHQIKNILMKSFSTSNPSIENDSKTLKAATIVEENEKREKITGKEV